MFISIRSIPAGLVLLGCALFSRFTLADIVNPDDWVALPRASNPALAELNLPFDAASKGVWSPVYDWPLNGLHAALIPDGRVLTFGTRKNSSQQNGRWFDTWDLSLGMGANAHNTLYDPNRQDSFCSAMTYLQDGSLLISGGNGKDTSTIYDPASHSSYTDASNMASDRWYSTMINLPDGRPLILGGMMPYTEEMANRPDLAIANGWPSMTPEIYENGSWRSLFGAYSRDAFGPDYLRASYPRAWIAPNGQVFGLSSDKMWYLNANGNGGNGDISQVWDFKQGYNKGNPVNVGPTSTAVMYAPGLILQVGGNGGFNRDKLPASNQATIVDIRNGTPVLREQPRMRFERRYGNSIVLPTGKVMVSGGTTFGNHYSGEKGDAVFATEIWDPSNGQWEQGPDANRIRVYHSITTLLPDGSVLSTGGGSPGPVLNLNAEIYYPAYFFDEVDGEPVLAERPHIKAISGLAYRHNSELQFDLESEESIKELALLGVSNSTHSFNSGQRRIPLTFSRDQFRISTQIPGKNLVPPGYYQLVAVNQKGVPSQGIIIAIGRNQPPPQIDVLPYDPPELEEQISTQTVFPGQAVTYSVSAEAGSTYSWRFSDSGLQTPYSSSAVVSHTYSNPGLYVVTLRVRSSNGIIRTKSVVQAVSVPALPGEAASSSPLALLKSNSDSRLWTVNPDNNSVSVIDLENPSLLREIPVGEAPQSITATRNDRFWVSNKHSSSLSLIDATTMRVINTVALPRGSQPHGLVLSSDQQHLYVVLEATGMLLKLNAQNGQIQSQRALGANVRHLAISQDGRTLLVSRFISPPVPGEATANVNVQAGGGEVIVVDSNTLNLLNTIRLGYSNEPDTDVSGRGIPNYLGAAAISPDGLTAWVPSKQDNIGRGQFRSGRELNSENTVRAISSRINLNQSREELDQRIDHDNAGVGSAAVYHPNGVYLFVALENSREVAVIDAIGGTELFRVQVGMAPQGLAVSPDGLTLYVKEFIDRRVSVVDLSDLINQGELEASIVASVATVSRETLPANVLAGKALFYDARDPRLSKDSYLSCASCHNDGGHDGRVWDFTDRGEGLRNTISLRGRGGMRQGFLHWSANFDEIQDFETQIRELAGGEGLMSDSDYFSGSRQQPLGARKTGISRDLDNLAAYVNSLDSFSPSPYRMVDNSLSGSAQQGKTLFTQHCQDCHGGANYSVSRDATTLSDIGTVRSTSGRRLGATLNGIDVPGLRDSWSTAPYLHDGSASTIQDAVRSHEGITLTTTQLAQLEDFVLQIGSDEPGTGLYPEAYWRFNKGTGTTAADETGQNNLNLNRTQWQDDRAGFVLRGRGINSFATANKSIVNTQTGFSVASWVKLEHLYNWQTFASQDGENVSGFWLHYGRSIGRKFAFSMPIADKRGGEPVRAISKTAPEAGQWYHIAGVYDPQAGQLKMYVNGVLESTAAFNSPWRANGEFVLGRGKWGYANDWLSGMVDDVNAFQYSLNDNDVQMLYEQDRPNYAPVVTILSPQSDSLLKDNEPVTLEAQVTDRDDPISEVRFYNGSVLLRTLHQAPWKLELGSLAIGHHTFSLIARDRRGAETASDPVAVEIEDHRLVNLAASAHLETSYATPWEKLEAIADGNEPRNSMDRRNGVYGNLNGRRSFGETHWVSLSWDSAKQIKDIEVYWWSDNLGVRAPTQAIVEYWSGSEWVKAGNVGVVLDTYNRLPIDIQASKIRISMSGERATGIIEVRVNGFD